MCVTVFDFFKDETTANTLSWALFELARTPDVQKKLREEIRASQAVSGGELSLADTSALPYLEAVVKVRLDIKEHCVP